VRARSLAVPRGSTPSGSWVSISPSRRPVERAVAAANHDPDRRGRGNGGSLGHAAGTERRTLNHFKSCLCQGGACGLVKRLLPEPLCDDQ